MGSSLFSNPSTFLTFIGLSNLFNLKPYFLANSELITSPVALLSNNTSTIIPSYVSILSSPIFTVTSLSVFPSIFLTSIFFSVPSNFNMSAFISVANILNLLKKSSCGALDSLSLLNGSLIYDFPLYSSLHIPTSFHLPLSLSAPDFYNSRPCAQNLCRCNSSFCDPLP